MRTFKRKALSVLCAVSLLALAACGVSRDDATTYIQGELDCVYKGVVSQEYVDLVEGMTEEDALDNYEANVSAEAMRMLSYLGAEGIVDGTSIYPEGTADDMFAQAEALVKEIYSNAKYTVNKADKLQSGDFAVEVVVSPIELFHLLPDSAGPDTWTQVCLSQGVEDTSTLSDEAYLALDVAYAVSMMEQVEALLPQLSYGEEQNVMLQMKLEDDYYTLVDASWYTLDDMIIDYAGSYL